MAKDVFIVDFARSPFTKARKGSLSNVHAVSLGSQVVAKLIERNKGIDAEDIELLLCGCAFPEGVQGVNLGRLIAMAAGMSVESIGITVNALCGSGMETIHEAVRRIQLGENGLAIAGGVESMSLVPMGGFNPEPSSKLFETMPEIYVSMGMTAEIVAERNEIDRKRQDEWALRSHKLASAAQLEDVFKRELVPIDTGAGVVAAADELIRHEQTIEALAKLPPAFEGGSTVTAGNSCPLTDGAAFLLLADEDAVQTHKLKPKARIVSHGEAGVNPALMGLAPVPACHLAMARAGLTAENIDVVEISEAFASQTVACIEELELQPEKVNPLGGSIAIGHPMGAGGARVTGHLLRGLKKCNGHYGMATICVGGGMGFATIVERV